MYFARCIKCGTLDGPSPRKLREGGWDLDVIGDDGIADAALCPKCVPGYKAPVVTAKPELHPLQKEFGFTAPEDGAYARYDDDLYARGAFFVAAGTKAIVPWIQYRFWWWLHNCVAHMAIGLLPIATTFRFHDWTSRRMHGQK